MTFDIDKFIHDLRTKGVTEGLPKDLIDKAIDFTRDFYQMIHDEPDIQDTDDKDMVPPDIPTVKGKKCPMCSKESIMDIPSKRKPCLICGFIS